MHNLLSFFFLADGHNIFTWLTPVIAVICLAIGVAGGVFVYKHNRDKKIGTATAEANSIVEKGKAEAKALKKEAILEAREETHKLKSEHERQVRERNQELNKQEQKLSAREEALDKREEMMLKKFDQLDTQQKHLSSQQSELAKRQNEIDKAAEKITAELERVAGLTKDEAKQVLIDQITADARFDRSLYGISNGQEV